MARPGPSHSYNAAKDRVTKRRQRIRAREAGLCGTCCLRPPAPGRKTCPVCLTRGHDRNRLISELMQAFRAS